jgi:hypothetical protein
MRSRTTAMGPSSHRGARSARRFERDRRPIAAHLALVCAFGLLLLPSVARATWSINITDVETKEVAVGTATCLNAVDLLALVPVIVVTKGSGAAQSFVDVEGTRRATIFDGLLNGTPPEDILTALEAFPSHQTRQYGLADTFGGAVTFTGTNAFPFADGLVGSLGSMVYAIQGNLLTGMPVLTAAEQALLTAPGDIPAKLMAAMQAARAMGGDGRCSCPAGPEATSCGSPPPSFTNSAIVGGMVVARAGDGDDPLCDANGCVDGDYFMKLNIAGQSFPNMDPVIQLQGLFDAFRSSLEGRPDAIQSAVSFGPAKMRISLLDWRGLPITVPSWVTVLHALDSDGLAAIGPAIDHGDGSFEVALTTAAAAGIDRFVVAVDDGIRPVFLMPEPSVEYVAIDIKPKSTVNRVHPRSHGLIPVAILGSSTFDVADVDATSLAFGPDAAAPADRHGPHFADVNGDGLTDFVSFYRVRETGISFGADMACVSGETFDGRAFQGCDDIVTPRRFGRHERMVSRVLVGG